MVDLMQQHQSKSRATSFVVQPVSSPEYFSFPASATNAPSLTLFYQVNSEQFAGYAQKRNMYIVQRTHQANGRKCIYKHCTESYLHATGIKIHQFMPGLLLYMAVASLLYFDECLQRVQNNSSCR